MGVWLGAVVFSLSSTARSDGSAQNAESEAGDNDINALMGAPLTEADLEAMTDYQTTVRDTLPPVTAGTSVVTHRDIAASHPPSADKILNLVPGVKIAQHGAEGKGHQIFLQGFDAAHGSDVEARVMGIPLNEPSHVHGQGYLDLYGIIPETVSSLTVEKGPYLPHQGDFATAGSLQFNLAVPAELRPGFVLAEVTHRGKIRAAAAAAPKDAPEETFAAAEVVRDPGFGPDRSARRAAFSGRLRRTLGKERNVDLLLLLQSARFESPETMRLSDVEEKGMDFWGAYEPPGHGLSDRGILSAAFCRKTGATDFTARVYGMIRDFTLEENFTGFLHYPEHGDLRRQAQHGSTAGLFTKVQHRLKVRYPLYLTAGAGWRFDHVYQEELQLETDGTPWQVNRQLNFSIHETHVFAGLRLSPRRWVTLFPSVRFVTVSDIVSDQLQNKDAANTEVTALPRLALSFPVHDKVTLFADYGRGYRTPEARAEAAAVPESVENERLSQYAGGAPEIVIADSVSIGLDSSPVPMLRVALLGFATFLDREMVFDHVSNLNVAMDGTRRIGLTAEASAELLPWLRIDANVTWTHARFNQSGNPVPGVPAWMGAAAIHAGKRRGLFGGGQVRWCGKRPLAHGASASGYAVLNLNTGYRFERFEVRAAVDNALNRKVMEGVYHFASHFDENEARSLIPSLHYAAGEPLIARFFLTVFL